METNVPLPSEYSLVDTYLISMLKSLRSLASHMHVSYFRFAYFFDKQILDMLIEAADDHIVDTSSNGNKRLLRFCKIPNELTVEVSYVLDNSSQFPYMITDVQDGFRRYFFSKEDHLIKFFPYDLSYPFWLFL